MIAELGLAALWLATALAGLQLVAGFLGQRENGASLAALVRPAAVMQALLCALAFGALLLLFIRTDLSVALVAKNSHVDKPFIFKFAGTWGNYPWFDDGIVAVSSTEEGLFILRNRSKSSTTSAN